MRHSQTQGPKDAKDVWLRAPTDENPDFKTIDVAIGKAQTPLKEADSVYRSLLGKSCVTSDDNKIRIELTECTKSRPSLRSSSFSEKNAVHIPLTQTLDLTPYTVKNHASR